MRKRTNQIIIRLSNSELAHLNAKVAKTNYNREGYIRAVLAGHEIIEAPDIDAKELMIELRRVGTNLNHLLFLAQCQNFIDVPALRKVTDALWECDRAIWAAYAPPSLRDKIWNKEG